MKKLALISIILISNFVFGQSPIEVRTIQLLNEYRVSKNLSPLVNDSGLNKAAEYHTKYLVLWNIKLQKDTGTKKFKISHSQDQDLPNFEEILEAEDRIRKFSGLEPPMNGREEIIQGTRQSKYLGLSEQDIELGYYVIYESKLTERQNDFYENLEKYIIDNYISSEPHRKSMINPEAHKVGISIYVEEIKKIKKERIIEHIMFCVIVFGS